MKKFILLFISILTFSFLITTNKTYAQNYSETIIKMHFYDVEFVTDWTIDGEGSTYEYNVRYVVDNTLFSQLDISKYYFITISHNIPFKHDENDFWNNSYDLQGTYTPPESYDTFIYLTVFLNWQFVNTYYSQYPGGEGSIADFFREHSALYITFIGDPESPEYDRGYNDGYNDGYNEGYNEGRDDGYNDGYDVGYNTGRNDGYNSGYNNGYINGEQAGYARGLDDGFDNGYNYGYNEGYELGFDAGLEVSYDYGYNDGYQDGFNDGFNEPFVSNIHIWLVPAIIIVFVVGIFVTYRRGRE